MQNLSFSFRTLINDWALMCAAPSGGAIWCAGDDAPGSNVISLTSCTVTTNNAQYGGALYASAGARVLVQQACTLFVDLQGM